MKLHNEMITMLFRLGVNVDTLVARSFCFCRCAHTQSGPPYCKTFAGEPCTPNLMDHIAWSNCEEKNPARNMFGYTGLYKVNAGKRALGENGSLAEGWLWRW